MFLIKAWITLCDIPPFIRLKLAAENYIDSRLKTNCKAERSMSYVCTVCPYVCMAAKEQERIWLMQSRGKTTALFVDRCLHAYGLLIG